jgi:hypothetical protein
MRISSSFLCYFMYIFDILATLFNLYISTIQRRLKSKFEKICIFIFENALFLTKYWLKYTYGGCKHLHVSYN